jgi:hypothetical protein
MKFLEQNFESKRQPRVLQGKKSRTVILFGFVFQQISSGTIISHSVFKKRTVLLKFEIFSPKSLRAEIWNYSHVLLDSYNSNKTGL